VWERVSPAGNVSQRIIVQIERFLADETLKPGERLPPEREMARLLGVSRPSLREAVSILQAQGRLIVRHGRGVFVAEPRSTRALRTALSDSEISIAELFSMREVLEVPAAGWAAETITVKEVRALQRILDELDSAFETSADGFERLARLDASFHLGIAHAARNRFLKQTTHVLNDLLMSGMEETLLLPGRHEKSRREHGRILAALRAGDAAGARRAAGMHIRSARRAALERVATKP